MAPRSKVYGDRLPPGTVGDRQVPQMPVSKQCEPPIFERRWARNGRSPEATLLSMLNGAANAGALFRGKQHFNILGTVNPPISSSGTRTRWRHSFRTGPYASGVMVMTNLVQPDTGLDQDAYAKLEIDDGSTIVATLEFHFGSSPTDGVIIPSGWQRMRSRMQYAALNPSTVYNAKWSDVDYGRLQSASVMEMCSLTDNNDGYLPQNITTSTPIVQRYRENLATMTRNLWSEGAAHALNWTVDISTDAVQTTSATLVNLLDGATSTVDDNSLGFRMHFDGHARLSQSGVPVVMRAYGLRATTNGGELSLVGETSGVIGTISNFGTIPSWKQATFNVPDATEKMDLQYKTAGGLTLTIHAVSMFELD